MLFRHHPLSTGGIIWPVERKLSGLRLLGYDYYLANRGARSVYPPTSPRGTTGDYGNVSRYPSKARAWIDPVELIQTALGSQKG